MPRKILCAVDDSNVTRDVAACALDLARGTNASVTFLAVDMVSGRLRRAYFWDPRTLTPAAAAKHKSFAHAAKAVRVAAKAGGDANIDYVSVVGSNAADAIIAYAAKAKADHIVIGTHTTSQIARIFVGSVATAVVSHATVPVTVVK